MVKKIVYSGIIFFSMVSCTALQNPTSGDGSSYQNAVIISAANEQSGVSKEYEWIRANYPGAQFVRQSVGESNGKTYDQMVIKTKDGEEKTVYFDISGFYGKF